MSNSFGQLEEEFVGGGKGTEEGDDVDPFDSMKRNKDENMAEVVLRWKANQNEVIKYANFVDDERPQYLFVVLENERSHLQHLKLVKIQGIEQTVRGS